MRRSDGEDSIFLRPDPRHGWRLQERSFLCESYNRVRSDSKMLRIVFGESAIPSITVSQSIL